MRIIIDGRQTANDLHGLRREMSGAVAREWDRLSDEAADFMRGTGSQGRFFNRTGRLRSSMRGSSSNSRMFNFFAKVEATAPYALFVDEGTRAHVIVPRNAPRLVFFWARVNRWVYATKVKHPGTTGRFFSRRTQRAFIRPFHDRSQAAIDRVAGRS